MNSGGVTAGSPSPSSRARSSSRQGRGPSALLGLIRRLSTSRTSLVFVILAGLALVIPNLVAAALPARLHRRDPGRGPPRLAQAAALGHGGDGRVAAGRGRPPAGLPHAARDPADAGRVGASSSGTSCGCRSPSSSTDSPAISSAGRSSTARVAGLISGELATTAVSLLTLVVYVAVMLPYDPLLAAVGVAIGSLNLVALRWFSRWRIDRTGRSSRSAAGLLAASCGRSRSSRASRRRAPSRTCWSAGPATRRG